VNCNAFVLAVPDTVVVPKGSYVYSVCTVPAPSESANVLPSASFKKSRSPAASVRRNVSSIARPLSRFAVALPPAFCSCTKVSPSYRNRVVVAPIVFARRRPKPSYAKSAPLPPLTLASWFRTFHVYVFVPSLVRFPLLSYANDVLFHVAIWFAASYVADDIALGRPVRAQLSPRLVRLPATS
jgi:hypothetical protein